MTFAIGGAASYSSVFNATIQFRSQRFESTPATAVTNTISPDSGASVTLLRQIQELKASLRPLQNSNIGTRSIRSVSNASVTSSALSFGMSAVRMQSVDEINTAPTSFTQSGPTWTGATNMSSWSDPGSTALATIGGSYSGVQGDDTLVFRVSIGGERGTDDLQVEVFDGANQKIDTIDVLQEDSSSTEYSLSNGLTFTLGEGDLVVNSEFELDVSITAANFSGTTDWQGSEVDISVGGSYFGLGTGELEFRVTQGGERGLTDIFIDVYRPGGTLLQTIEVAQDDPVNQSYALSNGLNVTFGSGTFIEDESFNVSVAAGNLGGYTTDPTWNYGTSIATLGGTYDGTNGNNTLTFVAQSSGTVGLDDIDVGVLLNDGSELETFTIGASDPIGTVYTLSNGIEVSFSAGTLIKDEAFDITTSVSSEFSTNPPNAQSTATADVHGVYDGGLLQDTLTVEIVAGGTRGTEDIQFEVRSLDGQLQATIDVLASDDLDTEYAIANGLNLTLGGGYLQAGETFTIELDHQTPTTYSASRPFNGIGSDNPRLDEPFEVVDGSFVANGVSIDVFASDTLDSLLGRINSSGAEINAVFEASSDRVVLTGTNGSSIVLGSDTSGVLAALKLDGAVATGGDPTDSETLITNVPEFAGVVAGTFDVNGVSISVDPNSDSVEDVLERIETLTGNVTSIYNENTGRVSIYSVTPDDLTLANDTSGLLAMIGLAEGTYISTTQRSEKVFGTRSRRTIVRSLGQIALNLTSILRQDNSAGNSYLGAIQSQLRGSTSRYLSKELRSVGVQISTGNNAALESIVIDKSTLNSSLRRQGTAESIDTLLFGSEEAGGFAESLYEQVTAIEETLRRDLAAEGKLLNIVV